MRGRRPKPTRMKILTGNPGKRRLNENEPMPEPSIPDCPPELGADKRARSGIVWWRRLAPLRMMTHLDRAALASYCVAYGPLGRSSRSHAEIWRDGEIRRPAIRCSRRTSPSPIVQTEIMMRIATEFGFTPGEAAAGFRLRPEAEPKPILIWLEAARNSDERGLLSRFRFALF